MLVMLIVVNAVLVVLFPLKNRYHIEVNSTNEHPSTSWLSKLENGK